MTIDQELINILVCPKCKGSIHLDEKNNRLVCEFCELFYEIKDNIPIMLVEEAQPLHN